MTRLDEVDLAWVRDRTLLKLDVQGYEDAVLRGATMTLQRESLVECELSVRGMYREQLLLPAMINILEDVGFRLIALNPGYYDPRTGEILEFDGMFGRRCG